MRYRFSLDPLLMRRATWEDMQSLAEHSGQEVTPLATRAEPSPSWHGDGAVITTVRFADGWETDVHNREIDVISPHEGD